jgi:6,7-dimethyl-8-ribityllumazine synthase
MSYVKVSRELKKLDGACIKIIAGKWHSEIVDSMITKCLSELEKYGCANTEVHILPGSYELPLAARKLLKSDSKIEAIIAFGVIVKGDTDHFEMIRDEVRDGFSKVMFEFDTPIIMEVLAVRDVNHARDRALDNEHNKGLEAARAAIEVIDWRRNN